MFFESNSKVEVTSLPAEIAAPHGRPKTFDMSIGGPHHGINR